MTAFVSFVADCLSVFTVMENNSVIHDAKKPPDFRK